VLRTFSPSSILAIAAIYFLILLIPVKGRCSSLASNNIPLDSPIYLYLEKLAGLGLITGDIKGIRPYSKSEAARLVLEAEKNLDEVEDGARPFADGIIRRLHDLIPRELSLYRDPKLGQWFDFNPMASSRIRYVYLDGIPRSFNRPIFYRGGQKVFGIIGGRSASLGTVVSQSGTEGTPLLENNEGIIYNRGHNMEYRMAMEAFLTSRISMEVEPVFLNEPSNHSDGRGTSLFLNKGYLKLGGGGLELEVGKDANWFGPGYRGALTLTDNAKNFDMVKISSPELTHVRFLGDLKYAFIFSRYDHTVTDGKVRQPWFFGLNLSLKPKPWFELGANFTRQEGGPGFTGSVSFADFISGGGNSNHSNTIAGFALRFRMPWLRNSELYGEYVGEDSWGILPFVESYVAGFFVPDLTASGKDDLRFEFFYGNPALYTDIKFPRGYAFKGMNPGHSQQGGSIEFFLRYSHWFSVRNNLALEYFHTERGNEGRVKVDANGEYDPTNGTLQAVERKNAARLFWNLPLCGETDVNLMYGWERIHNLDMVQGEKRTNQIFKVDISYRY
jgi:hypothetical protein